MKRINAIAYIDKTIIGGTKIRYINFLKNFFFWASSFGIGDQDYATILGVRPFPTSAYVQFSFKEKYNIAFEYSPMSFEHGDLLGKGFIICYGYRF